MNVGDLLSIFALELVSLLHSKKPRHKTVRTNLSSIRDSYDVLVLCTHVKVYILTRQAEKLAR